MARLSMLQDNLPRKRSLLYLRDPGHPWFIGIVTFTCLLCPVQCGTWRYPVRPYMMLSFFGVQGHTTASGTRTFSSAASGAAEVMPPLPTCKSMLIPCRC